jgi:hypothetical protein
MSMDSNDPYQAPADQSGAPQRGGGSKLLLGLGIGCGLMLLLCCGGGVAIFMIGKSAFHVDTAPAQVAAASEGITDMDVPPGFEPKTAVSMKNPFTSKKVMSMAMYEGPSENGMIMVAELGEGMPGNEDPQNMRLQIEQSMRQQQQQQNQGAKELQMEGDAKEVTVTVRGEECTFTIQRGKAANEQEFVQVEGTFTSKEGDPAFLLGQLPASDFSEEDAEAFIKSIK